MNSRPFSLIAAACLFAVSAWAATSAELHRQMEARLPKIDALKSAEAVGENNRGLLEVRPAAKADAAGVVAEENRDREAVYALIARQNSTSPEAVGKARARQIAAGSRAGVWIQDEGGAWRKK